MSCCRAAKCAILGAVLVACHPVSLVAQEFWATGDGVVALTLMQETLDRLDLVVIDPENSASLEEQTFRLELPLDQSSDFGFVLEGSRVSELFGLNLRVVGGVQIQTGSIPYTVVDLTVRPEEAASPDTPIAYSPRLVPGPGYLELVGLKAVYDQDAATFRLASREVKISLALAEALGRPGLAGESIGRAVIEASVSWVGGDTPAPPMEYSAPSSGDADAEGRGGHGPDMIFCQLYSLGQYGRLGDVVGLSVATTSWNIGDTVLPWFAIPNVRHPFIVMDLYRHKVVDGSERFEQIGQSWIKHGFCALDSSQCTTSCQGTGCSTLGLGCTDTYGAGLNASQGGLGPRYEVNPWTRDWTYTGSHMQGSHGHNAIEHRIQVHDADLDPAQNDGATYFSESFYVCPDDINQMNSAAWKPITVSGSPGGSWSFGMSSGYVMPETGFPVDAWEGATQTIIAEELPVVEFESPDGRCVLAAQATDLGGGIWHYEYALLNVDMHRKVRSFSIPTNEASTLTNIEFHGVEHHNEPYVNDPWTVEIAGGWITWSTEENPLRWGTTYNFRFDSPAQPIYDTPVTLGLYESGSPATVTGITIGPIPEPPDCNVNGVEDPCDIDCGTSGGECDLPGCGNSEDCDANGVPDECQLDFDGDGIVDGCDDDDDNDGVDDVDDECDHSLLGSPVRANGALVGDWNADCVINLNDFRYMDNCVLMGGPGTEGDPVCADMYDSDFDGDVDLEDVARFQSLFGNEDE